MSILSHQERETVNVLQGDTGSACHTVQRVFGHVERNVDLVGQTLVKSAQQGAATSQVDTVLYSIDVFVSE